MELKYGFIGAGNMGGAILRGALAGGALAAEETAVFGVQKDKLAHTAAELKIAPYTQTIK